MSGEYDDIINLPHPTSKTHPRMSMAERAAQFSPFAALTGFDDAVSETARHTDAKIELDEDARAALDERLRNVLEQDAPLPVAITWFVPDGRKSGGTYITTRGTIKKVDDIQRLIIMADGTRIPIDDVIDME